MLLAILTLVPFLETLGRRLIWPFDKNVTHNESNLWGKMGSFTWKRSFISLLIVASITVSLLLTYNGDKSYNNSDEIGGNYLSVAQFNLISEGFGPLNW